MEELSTPFELMRRGRGRISSDAATKSISESSEDIDPITRVSEVTTNDSFEDLRQCVEYSPTTNGLAVTQNGVPELLMKVDFKTSTFCVSWALNESEPCGIVTFGDMEIGSSIGTSWKFVPCDSNEMWCGRMGAKAIDIVNELNVGIGSTNAPDSCDSIGVHVSVEACSIAMALFTVGADSGDPGCRLPWVWAGSLGCSVPLAKVKE